jgi:hypothetical protein
MTQTGDVQSFNELIEDGEHHEDGTVTITVPPVQETINNEYPHKSPIPHTTPHHTTPHHTTPHHTTPHHTTPHHTTPHHTTPHHFHTPHSHSHSFPPNLHRTLIYLTIKIYIDKQVYAKRGL